MMISCLHNLLPFLPVIRRVFMELLRIASPFGHWTLDLCRIIRGIPRTRCQVKILPAQASTWSLAAIRHGSQPLKPPDFGNPGTENPAAPAGSALEADRRVKFVHQSIALPRPCC